MDRFVFSRRLLLTTLGAGVAMPILSACNPSGQSGTTYAVNLTDAEWRSRLSPEAFRVLREAGTEPAYSSPLNEEHRDGMFHCAGCNNAVFSSAHKFDSGTGWPSFWQEQPEAIGYSTDYLQAILGRKFTALIAADTSAIDLMMAQNPPASGTA